MENKFCYHQCSGNCRRVGCNCNCGEFHELDKNSDRVFSHEQLRQIEELKKEEYKCEHLWVITDDGKERICAWCFEEEPI